MTTLFILWLQVFLIMTSRKKLFPEFKPSSILHHHRPVYTTNWNFIVCSWVSRCNTCLWQLWGWSLLFGLGAGCLVISQLLWLIGNQSAADAALIKGAVESGVWRVSRGAVVRSAVLELNKTCYRTEPWLWLISGALEGNPRVTAGILSQCQWTSWYNCYSRFNMDDDHLCLCFLECFLSLFDLTHSWSLCYYVFNSLNSFTLNFFNNIFLLVLCIYLFILIFK